MKRSTGPIKSYHESGELARRVDEKTNITEEKIELIAINLSTYLEKIIESAFRDYCQAHSASKDIENKEWQRFRKFLIRRL